jgi:Zn-dependent alcohol dehydrogenase
VSRGLVKLKPLITKVYTLTNAQEAFSTVKAGVEIKVIIMNQE